MVLALIGLLVENSDVNDQEQLIYGGGLLWITRSYIRVLFHY
jgi:hypothetical protein